MTVTVKLYAYSVLKFFTGLDTAVLIPWKLTVPRATKKVIDPASANIHHVNFV
jgi:hypothetical protein